MSAAEDVCVFVQARMRSRRMPGKVLAALCGRPLLMYVLERLARCRGRPRVVVCTTDTPSDEPIASLCREQGVPCFRGAEQDVARRLLDAADRYDARTIVRVFGNGPLIDPHLVDQALERMHYTGFDLVTNALTPTFPAGCAVEAMATIALRRAYARMRREEERERVTGYFRDNASRFRIHNFVCDTDLSSLQLGVGTPEDLERIAAVVGRMTRPHWEYGLREIVERFCTAPA